MVRRHPTSRTDEDVNWSTRPSDGAASLRNGMTRKKELRGTPPTTFKARTSDQNESRATKRHWGDWFGPYRLVMYPKLALLTSLVGLAKFAWFVAFSASARS